MTKFGYALVAAVALPLLVLGLMSAAQAVPGVLSTLTVSKHVVVSGQPFTATATANVDCAWVQAWNGQDRWASGRSLTASFVAPAVTTTTSIDLVGTCTYPTAARRSATAGSAVDSVQRRVAVTVVPSAGGVAAAAAPGADAPGSGGPDRAVLLGGLTLVLAGAGAVWSARRRADVTDLPGLNA